MPSPVNPFSFLLAFLVFGLADYGLATMFADGRGPFDLIGQWRIWVYQKVQLPYEKRLEVQATTQTRTHKRLTEQFHWFYDGITCPICLSFWFALPMAALLTYSFYLTWYEFLAVWLALHGFARFLSKVEG